MYGTSHIDQDMLALPDAIGAVAQLSLRQGFQLPQGLDALTTQQHLGPQFFHGHKWGQSVVKRIKSV